MIKIIMHGCSGKMGKIICALLKNTPDCELVAGIDPSGGSETFPVYEDIANCPITPDAIIDFSTAAAVPGLIRAAADKSIPLVICTTGLSDATLTQISDASKTIPIFHSSNMLLGVNLISNILKRISPLLCESGFDVEIIEKHHNKKIDAPSGTAIMLADAVNASLPSKMDYVYDRSQKREPRPNSEIGIHAIRGGTFVGEHSIIFAGTDEVIEIKHSAMSKDAFAAGSIKAAKFIAGCPVGLYNMQDMLQNEI